MHSNRRKGSAVPALAFASLVACGTSGERGLDTGAPVVGGAGDGGARFEGTESAPAQDGALDVAPSETTTLDVDPGNPPPSETFAATIGGAPATVRWSIDRPELGTVSAGPSSTTTFTPSGGAAGLVTVTAAAAGNAVSRQIRVRITTTQNGAMDHPAERGQVALDPADLSAGGGIGGVGGEGLGTPVTDPATRNALTNPSDPKPQGLALLYPYDATVWPRGMLAPLLMWTWAEGDADAVQITLRTTSDAYAWIGTFGRPALLARTGGAFVRHPIPQDVWDAATTTAGERTETGQREDLVVTLTVAKGGKAYGPVSQRWSVAPARLTGTVYYNSYGTQLVKNWVVPDKAGHAVGGAILGIRSGDTRPVVVAGKDSPRDANGIPRDNSGCRACHVVASRGGFMLTQEVAGAPGQGRTDRYDLAASNVVDSSVSLAPDGVFAWATMVGDGSYALTNALDPGNPAILNAASGTATSSFWKMGGSPSMAAATGLPEGVAAGYPAFAPDDAKIAYIDVTGHSNEARGPLVVGAFDRTRLAFGDLEPVFTPTPDRRVGYPAFLPDDSAIVFEHQLRSGESLMSTLRGTRSELWWVKLGTPHVAAPLAALNGKTSAGTYLPLGPRNHGVAEPGDPGSSFDETGQDDTTLAYEPTVLPIVAGGYAWVVFTSRRLYGNVLVDFPWKSATHSYDTTDLAQATVKKLWVAAIDLNAPPGADPSHPAFYLPAQEILAGNSRGFWVLDPCRTDGEECTSGDQCCGGSCRGMTCGAPPAASCSAAQERCRAASDCCDAAQACINGFCAVTLK
jgi:hypothetical protein